MNEDAGFNCSNTTIFVTIGYLYVPANVHYIFLDHKEIKVGDYPDTIMDSVYNVRNEIMRKEGLIFPERLYYEVFTSSDPSERPFIWSDNSTYQIRRITYPKKQKGVKAWILSKLHIKSPSL